MENAFESIVEIRQLTKSYRRGGQVVPVLTNISFDIMPGDFIALMGLPVPAKARCSTLSRVSTSPTAVH